MLEDEALSFDSPLGAKVSTEAKERLGHLKATLIGRGRKATEQRILDCLIKHADVDELESQLPRKVPLRVQSGSVPKVRT